MTVKRRHVRRAHETETDHDATDEVPEGELTMRVPAMPADANANGDIFGGWVMAQMDLAAGIRGAERSVGRVATVAVNALTFRKPVKIGDTLCVYSTIEKIGPHLDHAVYRSLGPAPSDPRPHQGDGSDLRDGGDRRPWPAAADPFGSAGGLTGHGPSVRQPRREPTRPNVATARAAKRGRSPRESARARRAWPRTWRCRRRAGCPRSAAFR